MSSAARDPGTAAVPSRAERALRAWGRLAHQRPWLVLAIVLASAIPAGWLASLLTLRSSFLELLPGEAPPLVQMHRVLEHSQASSDVLMAIDARDRPRAEAAARALVERVGRAEGVRAMHYRVDVEFLRAHRVLYADEAELARIATETREAVDREVARATGFYIDLEDESDAEGRTAEDMLGEVDEGEIPVEPWAVTRDGRWLCVWALFDQPASDLDFSRRANATIVAELESARAAGAIPADLEVRLTGSIPQRIDEDEHILADLQHAGLVGFVSIVLLLVLANRTPRALVLLSLPLLIGLAWTFGFARLAIGHLNIISGFLFSILSGLGIEYGIHILHRYVELRQEGSSIEDAIEEIAARTGRALVAIGATNASVFGITALAGFSGFSEFGVIAGVGMLLTLGSTLLTLPPLLVVLERVRPMKIRVHDAPARGQIRVPRAIAVAMIAATIGFTVFSVQSVQSGAVGFESDWRVLAGDSPATRFGEELRDGLQGTFQNATIWARTDEDLPRIREAIEAVRARRVAAGQDWFIDSVEGIDDLVPLPAAQARRAELAAEITTQLERVRPSWLDTDEQRARLTEALEATRDATPFTRAEVPDSLRRGFDTRDGAGSLVHVRSSGSLSDTDRLTSWAAQMRDVAAELASRGIDAPLLSENWIAGEIFETIQRDAPLLLFGSLVVVFFVLLLDMRSVWRALLVLSPVLVGIACLFGALRLAGIDLNFMNAGILPVCVGISLDNAIHVYRRYLEEGRGSIPRVLRQTSAANLLSSSTNLLGFGALLLAQHTGLRSVGWLAVLGVTTTYLATSFVFPLVLQLFERGPSKTVAPEPAPAPPPP